MPLVCGPLLPPALASAASLRSTRPIIGLRFRLTALALVVAVPVEMVCAVAFIMVLMLPTVPPNPKFATVVGMRGYSSLVAIVLDPHVFMMLLLLRDLKGVVC